MCFVLSQFNICEHAFQLIPSWAGLRPAQEGIFGSAGFGSHSVIAPLAQGQGWLKSYPQTGLCSDKACVNADGANEFIEIARLQTVV